MPSGKLNWLQSGASDWRVWALVVCTQVPALHPAAKYLRWPIFFTAPFLFVAAFIIDALLLHHPVVAGLCRRVAGRTWQAVLIAALIALLNGLAYPRADARRASGRGSDQDDALIETGRRLVTGERPVYVRTYLGNEPSAGPGWALLVMPLAMSGAYFCLMPLALLALAETVARHGGGAAGRSLALILPLTSAAFWQQLVNGSDIFAVGVIFVVLAAALARWRPSDAAAGAAVLLLTLAAESSRIASVWACGLLAFFLWRRKHAGAVIYAALVCVIAGSELIAWLPEAGGVTPLAPLLKGVRMLGLPAIVAGAGATIVCAVVAGTQVNQRADSWWLALWIGIGLPVAAAGMASLASIGWDVAEWYEASYFAWAAVLLVAYVAAQAGGISYSRDRG